MRLYHEKRNPGKSNCSAVLVNLLHRRRVCLVLLPLVRMGRSERTVAMKFEIKHRLTGKILFELECTSLKVCVEKAVSAGANLRGANLQGAYLQGADLEGADLWGADLWDVNLRGADLRGADLRGADLWGADLRGADLRGADLWDVNLRGADLRGADLWDVNLWDANLQGACIAETDGEKITIKKTPVSISNLRWFIIIFDAHMKIGCEFHAIKEWWGFDDERISKMDSDALEFWKTNKQWLQGLCEAHKRG